MIELEEFYNGLMQETYSNADLHSQFHETQYLENVAEQLHEIGEAEGITPCHYKEPRGVRVDAYEFCEEEDTLKLFVVDFRPEHQITSLTKTDMEASFNRLENFFKKCLGKDFYLQLEETSPGYGLAWEVHDSLDKFSMVKMYLISNGILSDRVKDVPEKDLEGYKCSFNVWDVTRLHRMASTSGEQEKILIDFDESYGSSLPCLPAHLNAESYESYLVVLPGLLLADLYEKYGARLLEQNVRCFLQARGKVNKGIRNTILKDPTMFFAYNNGLTATAEGIELDRTNGTCAIKKLNNLQIVNGGQTSASIFSARKKDRADIGELFVQMKLSIVSPDRSLEVVPKISEFANSQNRVNAADFFANHEFHIRMEQFSRRIWAPASGSFRQSKWFYERARGQYRDAMAYVSKVAAKKFKEEFPKNQMFSKTELAKFLLVWEEQPHIVSFGAQKCFVVFARETGKRWEKSDAHFNELFFKRAIACAIIFKEMETLVSAQPWYESGGYRANIVAYSLSILAHIVKKTGREIDFESIWDEQKMPDYMRENLEFIAMSVNQHITSPDRPVQNVPEWCKKEACWDQLIKNYNSLGISLSPDFSRRLINKEEAQSRKKDAGTVQRIDDGIEMQARVVGIPGPKWEEALKFGIRAGLVGPKDVGIMNLATRIPEKIPTEKQCKVLGKMMSKLEENGFQFEEED